MTGFSSEVDFLLSRLGLEKYKDALRQHGLFSIEDLRQNKGVLALALPLGPKARLLKELNTTEMNGVRDDYDRLITILKPYMEVLVGLVAKLAEAGRKNPGGVAGKQSVIANATLKLCEKAVRETQRYQTLSKRTNNTAQADLTLCKINIGSAVRQLRQQQIQGVMRALEEADPSCVLPALDLNQVDIGQINKLPSPHRGNSGKRFGTKLDGPVIKQLRTLRSPPELVQDTIFMMLRMLGYEEVSWSAAKERMGSNTFLAEVTNFDETTIPPSTLADAGRFITDPDYTLADIKSACFEAYVVAEWIQRAYCRRTGHKVQDPILSPTRSSGRSSPAASRTTADDTQRKQPHPPPTTDAPFAQQEEALRAEAERLEAKAKHLDEREQRLTRREKQLQHPTQHPSPPLPQQDSNVLAQIQELKGLMTQHRVQPELVEKLNAIFRAAVTSRALIAHATQHKGQSGKKQAALDEDPADGSLPVGTQVKVTTWTAGTVTGHHRGRVGVELEDGSHVGAILPNVRCHPDCEETEESSTQANQKLFPVGLEVTILEEGTVTGASRGRVGLIMKDGTKRGVIPEMMRRTEGGLSSIFPVGTEVVVKDTKAMAKVTGVSRGRVGVELADGTKQGFLPTQISRKDSQEGLLADWPVGAPVVVSTTRGEVTHHARGRIGVELPDGKVMGLLPPQLRAAELTMEEMKEKYSAGRTVMVGGKRGTVTGCFRGRIGIELEEGGSVGVIPQKVQLLSEHEAAVAKFPVGSSVQIKEDLCGCIVGRARGRVGVVLENGKRIGCLPDHMTKLDLPVEERFPVGASVEVKMDAKVVGTSRGRVGIELKDGTKHGVLPDALMRKESCSDFAIGAAVTFEGRFGTVTSHARGRVGVTFLDGQVKGLIPQQLSRANKAAATACRLRSLQAPRTVEPGVIAAEALAEHEALVADVFLFMSK